MALNDHLFHLLLLTVPTFLGILLYRPKIKDSSFKNGLVSMVIVLMVINFGMSESLMVFHHSLQNDSQSHSCCIIQPSLGSVETPILPQSPKPQIFAFSNPCPLYPVPYLSHSSRAPPPA